MICSDIMIEGSYWKNLVIKGGSVVRKWGWNEFGKVFFLDRERKECILKGELKEEN